MKHGAMKMYVGDGLMWWLPTRRKGWRIIGAITADRIAHANGFDTATQMIGCHETDRFELDQRTYKATQVSVAPRGEAAR